MLVLLFIMFRSIYSYGMKWYEYYPLKIKHFLLQKICILINFSKTNFLDHNVIDMEYSLVLSIIDLHY